MTYRIHSLQEPPQLTQKSRKPLVSDGSKHIMIIHLKYRLIMESVRFRWISYLCSFIHGRGVETTFILVNHLINLC